MEPILIHYLITRRNVLELSLAASVRTFVFASAIGALICLYGLANGDVGSIVSGLLILAAFDIGLPLAVLYRTRTWIGEAVDLAFSDEGIRQDAFGRHFQGEWSALKSISRRLGYVLVSLRGGGTFGVPVAVFSSPAQVDTLLATARAHIAANKATAPTRA